jgi:hypothetical protein
MTTTIDHLPKGWQPLALEFVEKIEREFRGIVITDISAKSGWLSVDIDNKTVRMQDFWAATKFCEGVSSISWHVCVECGSHRAEQRPDHILPICDVCLS